jgi:PadR family transcriptional regulator PadR
MEARTEIPPGTLIMLILKTLMRIGPMHGYGIAQHIQASSDAVLTVEEGSLYPALQKMLIKDGWWPIGNNPKITAGRGSTG